MGSSTRRTASGPPVSVGEPGAVSDTGCHGTKTAPASRAAPKRGLLAIDDVEVGGDGGDIDDLTCGAQLVGGHVRETDMPDQAKLAQLRERADLVFE